MAKAVNEEWAPGYHTRVVAKIVNGSGDCDPVTPWPKPLVCAVKMCNSEQGFLKDVSQR